MATPEILEGSRSAGPSLVQPRATQAALAVGALLAAMVLFQIGASLAKGLFGAVGAPGAATLRLAFGAPLLTVAFRPWRARPSRAAWRAIIIYGVALGTMNLLFYIALATIPLGLAVALEFTGPLAVAMAASRRPIDFVWVILAAGGVLLILRPVGSPSALDPVGVACALGAGACWALYILFGQRAGGVHGLRTTALGMLIAAAVVVPIGSAQAGRALLSPHALAMGAAIGLVGTAVPYALEMAALMRLPARVYSILYSLAPAFGALAGLVMLGQVLKPVELVAIAAVVAASVGAAATLRPRTPALPVEP